MKEPPPANFTRIGSGFIRSIDGRRLRVSARLDRGGLKKFLDLAYYMKTEINNAAGAFFTLGGTA